MLKHIEDILKENGFRYCEYSGCFDIAARKDSMMLIKLLTNVDSLQEDQANSLKVMSSSLEARSMLVGLHTRREKLEDNVLYERFEIPTMNPQTFENVVIHNALPMVYQFRGGRFVEVSPEKLRSAREHRGLSQSELAEKVGITKKNVYEHESRKMKIDYANARMLEKVLKTDLTIPLEFEKISEVHIEPKTRFETKISRTFRRIGFRTASVYQGPFNMIAREKDTMILSDVEEKPKGIARKIPYIKNFAKLSRKSAVIITKEEANFDVPTVTGKKLTELDVRDIKRMIKKW